MSSRRKIVSLEALIPLVSHAREHRQTIVLANGVFDLLHVGHVRYLEGAKALGDFLVVAINSDASTRRYKGPGRPVVPEDERAELVASLGCVDQVVLFESPDVIPIIFAIRPDFQVKGTDYTPETVPEREAVLSYGGQVAVAGDPKDHATTEILSRLKGMVA